MNRALLGAVTWLDRRSDLEARFLLTWDRVIHGPPLVAEHCFAAPRRWRFDFAHVGSRVAIELQGGVWTYGRHNRAAGYERDCEKLCHAAACGWRVFPITAHMLRDTPLTWLGMVRSAIEERGSA